MSVSRACGAGHVLSSCMTDDRPSVLLYDWDNTLVDGWAGITAALLEWSQHEDSLLADAITAALDTLEGR